MKYEVQQELEELIKEYDYNCSVEKLKKIHWVTFSRHQKISEDFIREFKNEVCWSSISIGQKLSESFIRELYYFLDNKTFKKYFINENKITYERIRELDKIENINSRFELLDI